MTFRSFELTRCNPIRYLNKGLVNTRVAIAPPSSRGLGHLPFTEATGIRIPLGVS